MVIAMNKPKTKISYNIILPVLVFLITSLLSIKSAQTLLSSGMQNLIFKQLLWYALGAIVAIVITKIDLNYFYKHAFHFYIVGNILLILLLFFGQEVNDAKCWFQIPGIGSFQPSEFMKIILILVLSKMIEEFYGKMRKITIKDEFLFLIKVGIVVLIPSLLTFLQPDTGVVLIYFLITLTMLFIAGIRYRWFSLAAMTILIFITFLLEIYFFNADLFIKIFGTSFFLRVDRLLNWGKSEGFQLERGKASIGAAGFWGKGFLKTPIYFPEPQTDFIFAVFASNFGYFGVIILLSIILYFDLELIKLATKTSKIKFKVLLAGVVGMLIYQQFQNISMTFGLMPITGITLPFISYGGSSLVSYMIMIGFILNIAQKKKEEI